jgi:hypothetical protein
MAQKPEDCGDADRNLPLDEPAPQLFQRDGSRPPARWEARITSPGVAPTNFDSTLSVSVNRFNIHRSRREGACRRRSTSRPARGARTERP